MHSKETRAKAFAMYCAGIPPNKVGTLLGLNTNSLVYKWIKLYNWEEKRTEILKMREETATLSDREQDLKIVESVLALYSMKVKDRQSQVIDELKIKDVMEAVKLRRLLKGESTDNIQVNNPISEIKKLLEEDKE